MSMWKFIERNDLQYALLMILLFGITINSSARNRIVLYGKKPITAQISATDKGAMYIVKENINLNKKIVVLPQDAILQFEGGIMSNGELVGNNTTIVAGRYKIFEEILLSGSWVLDGIPVEWFGAIPNNANNDCSDEINKAISIGNRIGSPVLLGTGVYYTMATVDVPENGAIIGLSPALTQICYNESANVGVFLHGQDITLRNVCVQEYKMERKGICVKVGDSQKKVACTRGYVENIKTIGGNCGLDLEYQWCNKISGVNCRYNNIGLYTNETTPYVENAVIEGNYQYGVYSEGFGIKLYNAIIEGNRVGCVLNGRDNLLNNCYFEGNTASYSDKKAVKDSSGVDMEGGHLYAGEKATISTLIMIGCRIDNARQNNNTVCIDKCHNFTAIGCDALLYMKLTKNCTVKYIDEKYGETRSW